MYCIHIYIYIYMYTGGLRQRRADGAAPSAGLYYRVTI